MREWRRRLPDGRWQHRFFGSEFCRQPLVQWPPWAQEVAAAAQPGEQGIVETLERTVGLFGTDAFKLWHSETFGVWTAVCKCAELRTRWQVEFDYPETPV